MFPPEIPRPETRGSPAPLLLPEPLVARPVARGRHKMFQTRRHVRVRLMHFVEVRPARCVNRDRHIPPALRITTAHPQPSEPLDPPPKFPATPRTADGR